MKYPETSIQPVTDEYHGIPVEDPYRWLENTGDPQVRAWTDAQNHLVRETLDAIPQRAAFYDQLKKLYGEASPEYLLLQVRPACVFAIKKQPPLQQPMLVTLTSVDDLSTERVLLDPNQLDPSGGTAIDFYVASLDGRLAAISISKGGSERGDGHAKRSVARLPSRPEAGTIPDSSRRTPEASRRVPLISEGISHSAGAVAVALVGGFPKRRRSGRDRLPV